MKNILVPTDFSTEANYAFEVALQLARYTGGNVTLLHLLEALDDAAGGFSTSGGPVSDWCCFVPANELSPAAMALLERGSTFTL